MSVGSLLEIPQNIALALSLASTATGADYDYLAQTAYRESRFEAKAQAPTSSAQGLFQFIEETWLRTVKSDGAKYGLDKYAARIFKTRTGRHYVPDVKNRKEILALRQNPQIASLMAGVFARNNADHLAGEIGRKPTPGELYLAHFLGATDAIRLIKLARSNPNRSAARAFPKAAKANRRVFYDGKRARSARQIYMSLVRPYNREKKAVKYIRRLAKKGASNKGTANLKRHLRTRASTHALKAGSAKIRFRNKLASKAQGRWSTEIRPNIRALQLRGAVAVPGTRQHRRSRLARNY